MLFDMLRYVLFYELIYYLSVYDIYLSCVLQTFTYFTKNFLLFFYFSFPKLLYGYREIAEGRFLSARFAPDDSD